MKKRGADVTVKIPGKLMIVGEYSVLRGGTALAVTLDRHMTVHAKRLAAGEGVQVGSSLWDEPKRTTAGAPPVQEPLVDAAALGAFLFAIPDLAIRVESELDVRHGTGSSSAVRLGTLLAIEELARDMTASPKVRPVDELWPTARAAYLLQKGAQGAASGYDVATQLLGGLVRFRSGDNDETWPREAARVAPELARHLPHFAHAYVGGVGAPTTAVMGGTRAWLEHDGRAGRLDSATEVLGAAFESALAIPDDSRLAQLIRATTAHRRCLEESPAFPRGVLRELASQPGEGTHWSFKTTGAGGEDALLLIGKVDDIQLPARVLRRLGWHRLEAGFEGAGTTGVRISRRSAHG